MTLAQFLHDQFTQAQYLDFVFRLIMSCLCGAAIGIERARRLKEAGIRTHVIVCCASALTMIISKYGFVDMVDASGVLYAGTRAADPSRIAAQTISGISFLGAGVIFKHGNSIRGLTTAAGIWATAGIGLAIGSGMYIIGVLATVIIFIAQCLMHKFTIGNDAVVTTRIQITSRDFPEFWPRFAAYLQESNFKIVKTELVRRNGGVASFEVYTRSQKPVTMEILNEYIAQDDSVDDASTSMIF